jgi:hypothetical protein
VVERIQALLTNSNANLTQLYDRVGEVKMAAGDKQVMALLTSHFELFYRALLELDTILAGKGSE